MKYLTDASRPGRRKNDQSMRQANLYLQLIQYSEIAEEYFRNDDMYRKYRIIGNSLHFCEARLGWH